MLEVKRIQLITLDLDDTLWEVKPVLMRAEQELRSWLEQHYPKTKGSLSQQRQQQLKAAVLAKHADVAGDMTAFRHQFLKELAQLAGYPHSLADQGMRVFLHWRNQVSLYPGVEESLNWLAQHYPIIALSNGNADLLKMDIGRHFVAHYRASTQLAAKPAVDMFMLACEKMQLQPEAVLHIGDDLQCDIEPARSLGMQTAYISAQSASAASITTLNFAQVVQTIEAQHIS